VKRLFVLLPLLWLLTGGAANEAAKSVSLVSFGADTTGTNDVSGAFIAAINAGASHIDVPPGSYLLNGTATVALNNIEVECHGTPAGLNTSPYGGTGATVLLTSTSVQPFTVQNAVRIKGCNFFWPNQTGSSSTPTAYPPLFTEPTGHSLTSFVLESDRIINAYDVLDQSAIGDFFGDIMLANTQGYAIRYWFQLENVTEWMHLTNFHADYGLYQTVADGAPNYYLANWTAANGAVFHVFGNGNCSSTGSSGNVGGIDFTGTVFAYNKFVWVDCSGNLSESKFRVMLDGVQHAFELDADGCASDVEVQGSYLTYLATFPNPSQGGSDNAAMISIGAAPGTNCGTTDLRFSGDLVSAQGDVIDITGSGPKGVFINISGAGLYGDTSAAGTYYFANINSSSVIADFVANHIEPPSAHQGSTRLGFNLQNCYTCTLTGNSFNGVYSPIVIGSTLSNTYQVAAKGNVSLNSPAGGTAISGTGDTAHELLLGNTWDKFPLPVVSACGTGGALSSTRSGDLSGQITVGTGVVTSCTLTFANAWTSLPRCSAGTPSVEIFTSTSTSVLTMTSSSTMNASGPLTFRCDAGW
jgi:hypothetical protein